jgi:hypothetical protein
MTTDSAIQEILSSIRMHSQVLHDPDVAHVVIDHNRVLSSHLLPGLEVDVNELAEGIEAHIRLADGAVIDKRVHFCFGMVPKEGIQRIGMNIDLGEQSRVAIQAHCTFPNAMDIQHLMDANIKVGPGAVYDYFERHVHGPSGGVTVVPKAKVELGDKSKFKTEFELISGRAGDIDIEYETTCGAYSVMEMTARITGAGDDLIKIKEIGHLLGEGARGALTTKIAVKDQARAEVYNKLTASAAYALGHVDCKEVVQDQATASAIPIVEVNHPKAHVTHEAAIGSVDTKQMETLMARGLDEDTASDLIIQGMLS